MGDLTARTKAKPQVLDPSDPSNPHRYVPLSHEVTLVRAGLRTLIPCPTCSREVSKNARSCPGCGEQSIRRTVRTSEEIDHKPCLKCRSAGAWLIVTTGWFSNTTETVSCDRCAGTGWQKWLRIVLTDDAIIQCSEAFRGEGRDWFWSDKDLL
jgi:hypothetical protein